MSDYDWQRERFDRIDEARARDKLLNVPWEMREDYIKDQVKSAAKSGNYGKAKMYRDMLPHEDF
jgi:hypothetical protein